MQKHAFLYPKNSCWLFTSHTLLPSSWVLLLGICHALHLVSGIHVCFIQLTLCSHDLSCEWDLVVTIRHDHVAGDGCANWSLQSTRLSGFMASGLWKGWNQTPPDLWAEDFLNKCFTVHFATLLVSMHAPPCWFMEIRHIVIHGVGGRSSGPKKLGKDPVSGESLPLVNSWTSQS